MEKKRNKKFSSLPIARVVYMTSNKSLIEAFNSILSSKYICKLGE